MMDLPTKYDVADSIREYLDAKEMTVKELVAKTRVSQSGVYRILQAHHYPSVEMAMKIAWALDITLDELIYGRDK